LGCCFFQDFPAFFLKNTQLIFSIDPSKKNFDYEDKDGDDAQDNGDVNIGFLLNNEFFQ